MRCGESLPSRRLAKSLEQGFAALPLHGTPDEQNEANQHGISLERSDIVLDPLGVMFDPIKASTLLPDNSMPRLRMTYDLATHSQESNQSVITFAPRNMLAGSGRFGEVISGPAQFHPRASNRTRHRALGRGGGGSVGLSTDSQEPPAAAANPVSYVVLKLVCLKGTDPHSPDLQSLAGELRWLIQEAQIYSGAAKAQQGRTIPVYYGLYPARVKATRLGEKEVCMRRPKHGEEPDHILVNILLECLYNSRQDGYNVDSDVEV